MEYDAFDGGGRRDEGGEHLGFNRGLETRQLTGGGIERCLGEYEIDRGHGPPVQNIALIGLHFEPSAAQAASLT